MATLRTYRAITTVVFATVPRADAPAPVPRFCCVGLCLIRLSVAEGFLGEVTELLERARAGDAAAWDRVVALIYQDLKRIARGVLAGSGNLTLDPTSLVHDCYLRLSRGGAEGVINREHFLALAARAMRQLMLNHARDRVAAKPL